MRTNREIVLEVESLLSESEELIAQGKTAEASAKIAEAKGKLRLSVVELMTQNLRSDETSD